MSHPSTTLTADLAAVTLIAALTVGCSAQPTPTPAGVDAGLDLRADLAADRGAADRSAADVRADADADVEDAASDAAADGDGDGLLDSLEEALARAYFPFLSVVPGDKCPLHGVVFRLRPHPTAPALISITYAVLYARDCGVTGHVGDNEVFGALVDPQKPAPAGLLALRAVAHQGTICEKKTSCGSLPGCTPCTTAFRLGQLYPVVFASRNKHGGFVSEQVCDASLICDIGGCEQAGAPSAPPFVNAGEPGAPLVSDLTTQGFITTANGWTDSALHHFDPWGSTTFGGAGRLDQDLVDPVFVLDPSGC